MSVTARGADLLCGQLSMDLSAEGLLGPHGTQACGDPRDLSAFSFPLPHLTRS